MDYEDELDRMRAQKRRNSSGGKRSAAPRQNRTYYENGAGRNPRAESMGRPDDVHQKLREQRLRKKRKKKRLLLAELVVLALLVVGAFFVFGKGTNQKGYWTIAIFGVDSRDGKLEKGALSDVEMICNIDKATGEIKLVSVYRDTYLKINDEGTYHKINEAYFKGGHEQAVEALNENLDLKIDDYATFNWKSVAEAINILGGVDIEITDAEFAYINGFITETVESTGIGSYQLKASGANHLDGVQAVAYARLRLMDTDFNRTERQRKVVTLALEKAKQADFGTLKTLVATVFPQIRTSVGIDDLFTIAKGITKYHIGETAGFPFSRTTMKIGRMDCVIATTLESNVIQLHQFLYNTEDFRPSPTVKSISAQISKESGISEPGENTPTGGGSKNKNSGTAKPAPQETAPPETLASTKESIEESVETPPETLEETTEEVIDEPETNEDGSLVGPGASGSETPENNRETKNAIETKETEKETKAETKEASREETKTPETSPLEPEKGPGSVPAGSAESQSQEGPGEEGPGV